MERGDGLPAGDRPLRRAHPLTDPTEPRPLVQLGEYDWPSLPPQQTLRRWRDHLLHALRPGEDAGPVVERGKLDRSTHEQLDAIAAGPATAPAEADLKAALDPWVADATADPRLQVIVLPPGAPRDPLATWAQTCGLACLAPPARQVLADMPGHAAPDLSGGGVLVIPRLEDWMLRHETGLDTIRALLAALATTDRRVVVGCGSWAWAFLSKAVDVDLALPPPRTPAPHDAERLKAWLLRLSDAVRSDGTIFRLTSDGTDVFGADEDGDGHFRKLAASSFGIPWIAWTQWRTSLRALTAEDHEEVAGEAETEAAHDDERTVWIVDPSTRSLPDGHEKEAMMVLHAVLVHGTLEVATLDRVLPGGDTGPVLEALVSTDFLQRDGTLLSASPYAYADARRALVDAGFPPDEL